MSGDHELIAAPLELWLAPRGTSFPLLGVTPSGAWELLGKLGDKSYTDDGVTIGLPQTIETFRPAGGTMARKAWRTESGITVGVTVADVRGEIMQIALNGNELEENGNGRITLPLLRGVDVTTYALLARGPSPMVDNAASQFQVPACYVDGEPDVVFTKGGDPAAVEFEFVCLEPEEDEVDDFAFRYDTEEPE